MSDYVDLHMHSTASDGTDSPAALVEKAKKAGLSTIALTDHDSISGLAEAREAANDLGVELIAGCELSTRQDGVSRHVLGLWVPENSDEFNNFLDNMRKIRADRNAQIIAKLRNLGLDVSLDEVRALAKCAVGRPHIGELLVKKGFVENRAEAFTKYLNRNAPAYVPKKSIRPEEAVRMLSSVGATVSLAHPLLECPSRDWLENLVASLAPLGLGALEAWHSSQDENGSRYLTSLARIHGLGVSGGSDYHGDRKPGIHLGKVAPGKYIPAEALLNLKKIRREKGLPC